MKKRNRKISCLLAFVMLLTTMLSGCGGTGEKMSLFTDGKANFIIVRSNDATNEERQAANELRQIITDNLGITPTYKPDTVKHQEGTLEIVLGKTNRPHTEEVYKELANKQENNGLDYIIKQKQDYIYIMGMTTDALTSAIEYFKDNFLKDTKGGIAKNYTYVYNYKSEKGEFAIAGNSDVSSYRIVTPRYNMSYLVGREVTPLSTKLMYATGYTIPVVTDNEAETEYEIIIDNCKRDGIPEVSDADAYYIKVVGKKVYLGGGSNEATSMAVRKFAEMVEAGKSLDKSADIKGSYAKDIKEYDNEYSLTLADEFDTIDRDLWNISEGRYSHSPNPDDPRVTYFSADSKNLYTKDGVLYMVPTIESDRYNGVEMRTDNSVWFKYGFIEVSAKIHSDSGQLGAFWILGNAAQDYHGEVDIFEACHDYIKATPLSWVGKTVTGAGSDTYYCGWDGDQKTDSYLYFENDDLANEFHTFGVEWTEDHITWVYDGREFLTINTTVDDRAKATYNGLSQIILTQYSGCNVIDSGWADETTDWENARMAVDYMRLYQLPGQELVRR